MGSKGDQQPKARKTKNITLSVDEDVLAAARRYAAAHDTTINSLVRDFLTSTVEKDDRIERARKGLLKLIDQTDGTMGPIVWNREDLYDR